MEPRTKRKTWMAAAGAALATVASAQGVPGPSSTFQSTPPVRVLDTRTGLGVVDSEIAPIGPAERITLDLTEALAGFDPGPNAVVVNVGVEGGSAQSFVALLPFEADAGATSNVNFDAGQTIANQATVQLGGTNQIDIFNAAGSVDVFIDLQGVFGNIV
ncbi:MAG: hypothetical protein GEV08_17280 [Acidimicrobiia bacterium]|nr:hypothetical protein [Acidimicrobiia bacterium]